MFEAFMHWAAAFLMLYAAFAITIQTRKQKEQLRQHMKELEPPKTCQVDDCCHPPLYRLHGIWMCTSCAQELCAW